MVPFSVVVEVLVVLPLLIDVVMLSVVVVLTGFVDVVLVSLIVVVKLDVVSAGVLTKHKKFWRNSFIF